MSDHLLVVLPTGGVVAEPPGDLVLDQSITTNGVAQSLETKHECTAPVSELIAVRVKANSLVRPENVHIEVLPPGWEAKAEPIGGLGGSIWESELFRPPEATTEIEANFGPYDTRTEEQHVWRPMPKLWLPRGAVIATSATNITGKIGAARGLHIAILIREYKLGGE